MKPSFHLFHRILLWFFLNLAVMTALLLILVNARVQLPPDSMLGEALGGRFRNLAHLISMELNELPESSWPDVLRRYAEVYEVTLLLFDPGGGLMAGTGKAPEEIRARVVRQPMPDMPRPRGPDRPPPMPGGEGPPAPRGAGPPASMDGPPPPRPDKPPLTPRDLPSFGFSFRTRHPDRYWSALPIPIFKPTGQPPKLALLVAGSTSRTGGGLFFDPRPMLAIAIMVFLVSALLWWPLVRSITRPLKRMTVAAEEIARGRFDIQLNEPRTDEIGRLARSIDEMASRLDSYDHGRKRFLGDVAHELASPLARIKLSLGILENRVESGLQGRVVDVMEDADHLSSLIEELLAFTRAEIDPNRVALEQIPLLAVARKAMDREGRPDVRVDLDVPENLTALAAPELLLRALANLIRNAVRYAGHAGPIQVRAGLSDGKAFIEVLDQGPGVPEEHLERLFDPFYRPDASREASSGGTGLGLSIVQTCVTACGGTVACRNRQPRGFAVTILLPRA